MGGGSVNVLKIKPCSFFFSSLRVTRTSSQVREGGETEREREQGNGGNREGEGNGNRGIGTERENRGKEQGKW
jgi:hypothetical protein